jgi:hypothetical protein
LWSIAALTSANASATFIASARLAQNSALAAAGGTLPRRNSGTALQ